MKSPALKILALSIILGSFLRVYKLNTNYVWFNDTFFRLTPALEILKGVPVQYDPSMIGVTGLGLLCFSISENLYSVVLAVCITGILCIPLSYYFVLKLTNDERIAAVTALFVSINPTLVALSKVLLWDIFVLFFFLLSGIVFLSLKEKPGILKGILLSVMLFMLFSFKLPNVLFAVVFYFFLFYSRKFSIKDSKDIIVSGVGYITLLGGFFYSFPTTLNFFTTGGGTNFFLKENYLSIVIATLKLLFSPVSSPPTSMAFTYDMGINIFFVIGLVSLIPLVIYIRDIKNLEDLFPVTIVVTISLLFINYGGWSHRYLTVPLFLSLVFLSYGIIKIKQKNQIIALSLILLCCVASFGLALKKTDEWASSKSLAENHVATPLSLFDSVVEMTEIEGVDTIASPYGRVFEFYFLSEKLNYEVIDFYALDEVTVEREIKDSISNGKKVWYVEGWPDVYVSGGKNTIPHKKIIETSFSLDSFYVSREMIYVSDGIYPSLVIYEVR